MINYLVNYFTKSTIVIVNINKSSFFIKRYAFNIIENL